MYQFSDWGRKRKLVLSILTAYIDLNALKVGEEGAAVLVIGISKGKQHEILKTASVL